MQKGEKAAAQRRHAAQAQPRRQVPPRRHVRGRHAQHASKALREQILARMKPHRTLLVREHRVREHVAVVRIKRRHRQRARLVLVRLAGQRRIVPLARDRIEIDPRGCADITRSSRALLRLPQRIVREKRTPHDIVRHLARLARRKLGHQLALQQQLDQVVHGLRVVVRARAEVHDRDAALAGTVHMLQRHVRGSRGKRRLCARQRAPHELSVDVHAQRIAVRLDERLEGARLDRRRRGRRLAPLGENRGALLAARRALAHRHTDMHTRVMEERAPDKGAVRPVQHGPRVLRQMRAERLDERKEALDVRALLAVQRHLTHAVLQQTRQHTSEEEEGRGAAAHVMSSWASGGRRRRRALPPIPDARHGGSSPAHPARAGEHDAPRCRCRQQQRPPYAACGRCTKRCRPAARHAAPPAQSAHGAIRARQEPLLEGTYAPTHARSRQKSATCCAPSAARRNARAATRPGPRRLCSFRTHLHSIPTAPRRSPSGRGLCPYPSCDEQR